MSTLFLNHIQYVKLQIDLQYVTGHLQYEPEDQFYQLSNQCVKSLRFKFEPVVPDSKRTLLSKCWNVRVSITENNIEKSIKAKSSLCLTLFSIVISSNNLPLMTTSAFITLCNCLSIFTNIGRYPVFPSSVQSTFLLTISKAFIKNRMKSDLLLSTLTLHLSAENIMPVAPLPDLKLHCDSGMTKVKMFQSNWFSKALKKTRAKCIQKWFHGIYYKFL